MKKIFAVSIMAVMAVTAANAEIASKAYVDQQDDAVEAMIGNVANLDTTAKTVVPAINELVTKTGTGTVAEQIAAAVDQSYTPASTKAQSGTAVAEAIATVSGTAGSAVQSVKVNGTALEKDANNAVNVTVPTGALASKDTVAESDLASALATKINGKADAADLGDLAALDEVAESDLASALATKINAKLDANESITAASGNNLVAYDENGLVVSGVAAGTAATATVETTGVASNTTTLPTTAQVKSYVDSAASASNFVHNGITDGVTDKAPSEDAVHDALALKADAADLGDLAALNEVAESDLASALATKINAKLDANESITAASGNNLVAYDENGLVVSGVAAGTAATATVETTGVASNTTTLPTTAQVKSYVDSAAAASNFVEDSITDGVTAKAPSENAVFDALAEKQGLIGSTVDNDGQYVLTADLVSGAMTNYRWELVQRATSGGSQQSGGGQ